jgi:AraC-like DNA-binding protein
MHKSPNHLSWGPHELALEDPRGDVLADVLGGSLLRNAMYRRIECGAPWGMAVPARDRAVFYVLVRGTARIEVEREPVVELSAGDTVFIPHGAPHVVRDAHTSQPVSVCDGLPQPRGVNRRLGGTGAQSTLIKGFFQFVGRKPSLLDGMPPVIRLTSTDPTHHRWTAATLQLLLAESASPGPASVLVLQRLADVLFVQTLRALATQHHGLAALSDPAINEALTILHARLTHPWTVGALAKQVGLSRSGFAARFTSLVGEPPLQYLTRWRVGRAAELLRDTQRRVTEIAQDVGYDSVPSFNKAFRKWQGESPTAFRARYGSGVAAP